MDMGGPPGGGPGQPDGFAELLPLGVGKPGGGGGGSLGMPEPEGAAGNGGGAAAEPAGALLEAEPAGALLDELEPDGLVLDDPGFLAVTAGVSSFELLRGVGTFVGVAVFGVGVLVGCGVAVRAAEALVDVLLVAVGVALPTGGAGGGATEADSGGGGAAAGGAGASMMMGGGGADALDGAGSGASQAKRSAFGRFWTPLGPLTQDMLPSVKAVKLSALRQTISPPAVRCSALPFSMLKCSSSRQAPTTDDPMASRSDANPKRKVQDV